MPSQVTKEETNLRKKFKRNNDFVILRCIKDFLLSHIHFYISILLATFRTGYLFEHYRAIYYGQSKPDNRSFNFFKHMKISLQSNTWLNTTRTMLIKFHIWSLHFIRYAYFWQFFQHANMSFSILCMYVYNVYDITYYVSIKHLL